VRGFGNRSWNEFGLTDVTCTVGTGQLSERLGTPSALSA
jgi:hypothetical protein